MAGLPDGGPDRSAGGHPGRVRSGGHGAGPGQAAQRLGKSRSALANSLRLLGLPPEALELLRSGALTAGHAKAILGLPTPELQVQAAKLIAEHSLNVRQAEALCRKLAKDAKQAGQAPAPEPPPRPALPVEVEESLRQALGSEVSVAYKNGRGSLTVHFYSDDQLRAFANLLGHYDLEGTGPAPVAGHCGQEDGGAWPRRRVSGVVRR